MYLTMYVCMYVCTILKCMYVVIHCPHAHHVPVYTYTHIAQISNNRQRRPRIDSISSSLPTVAWAVGRDLDNSKSQIKVGGVVHTFYTAIL